MAKGKRGPALFELLGEDGGRTPGGVKVPSWWSRHNRIVDLHAAPAVRSRSVRSRTSRTPFCVLIEDADLAETLRIAWHALWDRLESPVVG